ncbi:MAG: peptidoglycan DD-metalloendopeptidase family protein [Bacteroidota bacterium]
MLTDTQLELLEQLLRQELSYVPLREELLDHLCCAIEAEMTQGLDFTQAQSKILDQFGAEGLAGVQKQTLHILTLKQKRMKQLIYLGGLAAVISFLMMFSAFSQHLPTLVPMKGEISSEYGKKSEKFHHGIDIKAAEGTPVYAAADGTVQFANEKGNYGILLEVKHTDAYVTKYAHLSKLAVKSGDVVKQGQLIAYCGNTGKSTGPHLHFEVRKNGKTINPRDLWSN